MELIHIANGDYPRYEELLFEREKARKEAEQYQIAYIREFGDLITAVFEQKIKCIELKKSIAFCQMNLNAGKPFDAEELQQYLTEHMAAYYDQLSDMVEEQKVNTKYHYPSRYAVGQTRCDVVSFN